MRTTVISIICVLTIVYAAAAFDPPEVIGYLSGSPPSTVAFGADFCCIGDVNGDGYDDLLTNHDPIPEFAQGEHSNTVEIFYGGSRMNDEVDMIFNVEGVYQSLGRWIIYLGRITDEDFPYFAIAQRFWPNGESPSLNSLHMHAINEDLGNDPTRIISLNGGRGPKIGYGRRTRPADINGDGFHDLIAAEATDSLARLEVFWGGEEFDTIPDWCDHIYSLESSYIPTEYSSGFDINTDGYDDILFKIECNQEENPRQAEYWYSMYLGGEEDMDTIPVFEFRYDHFEQGGMRYGFSMLQDVNDDGYDDWGVYFYNLGERITDGCLIFFGGEEPDMEPDLELDGHHALYVWASEGDISGGDFNGDGIGDIITGQWGGYWEDGEINIHFGSRDIDEEPDMIINGHDDYGEDYDRIGEFVGGIGDYNNDGVDDFVTRIRANENSDGKLVIFAGNRDWRSVDDEKEIPGVYELCLDVSPNPFNSEVRVSFSLPSAGHIMLSVYDIHGRLVEKLDDQQRQKGEFSTSWESQIAGIYFVVLQLDDSQVVRKVVCLP